LVLRYHCTTAACCKRVSHKYFSTQKGLGYAMDSAASLRAEAIPLWGGVPFEVSSGGETARGYEPRG